MRGILSKSRDNFIKMSKPLITIQNLKIVRSNKILLSSSDISIHEYDRIILVGKNGCGKSSFLKTLKKTEEVDDGIMWFSPNLKLSYLEQDPPEPSIKNLVDFLIKDIEFPDLSKVEDIINQLNLKNINYKKRLSGGEIRKIYIAKSILSESDILLLDEPTNHIDLPTIEWLERKLLFLKKTMVIVSHDQEFLKKIGTKTFWLHNGKILKREGPYENFNEWSKELIEVEKIKSHKLKQKIKSETKWSIEGISARRKRNMGRVRALEKLSQNFQDTKIIERKPIDLNLRKTNETGVNIVEAFEISFAHKDDNKIDIISNFNLKIIRNSRIGIIGANGTGKTTLIKILQGVFSPTSGRIKIGEHIKIKYFDQNKESIDLDSTPWRTITESGDYVDFKGEKIHVLSYLRKFLFDEKKSLQSNSTLSGGEKARLLLAKLFLNKHNFLILDEPTNDLDYETLNLLKEIIKNYDGTVLIISHDRFFLDHTIDKLIVFENNGKILKHEGNFSNYYEKYAMSKLKLSETKTNFKKKELNNKKSEKNILKKKKLTFKDTYELKILPQKIEEMEKELEKLESLLSKENLYKDDKKTFDHTINQIGEIKKKLSFAEERWLEIQIFNDEINKQ